jgi:hypothetical protein
MIDKYNLDLQIMKQIVKKKNQSVYTRIASPHLTNHIDPNKMHLYSQIKEETPVNVFASV